MRIYLIATIAVLSLLTHGCSTISLFMPADREELHRYALWRKQQLALFDPYLGKTSKEIELIFGKPKRVGKTMPGTFELPYDFVWEYELLPIGESKTYKFFFKGDRLSWVEVLGQR